MPLNGEHNADACSTTQGSISLPYWLVIMPPSKIPPTPLLGPKLLHMQGFYLRVCTAFIYQCRIICALPNAQQLLTVMLVLGSMHCMVVEGGVSTM